VKHLITAIAFYFIGSAVGCAHGHKFNAARFDDCADQASYAYGSQIKDRTREALLLKKWMRTQREMEGEPTPEQIEAIKEFIRENPLENATYRAFAQDAAERIKKCMEGR
jgi:hypothetical protein